jgi:hypothetical protein
MVAGRKGFAIEGAARRGVASWGIDISWGDDDGDGDGDGDGPGGLFPVLSTAVRRVGSSAPVSSVDTVTFASRDAAAQGIRVLRGTVSGIASSRLVHRRTYPCCFTPVIPEELG